jgi:hypothetical protein
VFRDAVEPLDAKEWIDTIEEKFRLLRLTKELKVEYAAHQLQGPAGTWWRNQRAIYATGVRVTWDRFTTAFRNNYIPPGLKELKVEEFMALNQGTKPIKEYIHQFNSLSCYCPEFMNTDALKIASFKRGLNLEMKKSVGTNSKPTFHAFISDCLTQESNNLGYATVENRKRAFASSQSQLRAPTGGHPPYRLSVSGAKFKPPQKRFQPNQGQRNYQAPGNQHKATAKTGQSSQGDANASGSWVKRLCYNCGQTGHFSRSCPLPPKKRRNTTLLVCITLL